MTTTANATAATGLIVMLEAAGRTIASLEGALEAHAEAVRARDAELEEAAGRAHELEHQLDAANARVAELEEHARTMPATDGEGLVAQGDAAPDAAPAT